jgi:hypothetical protein
VLKWTLGVLGAIVVGALGSGVWQSLLGPAIHFSSRWVLDVASLGLTSYKNGVYQRIAADNQSSVAVTTLLDVTALRALISVFVIVYGFYLLRTVRLQRQHMLREFLDAPPNPEPAMSQDALRQKVIGDLKLLGKMRIWLYVLSLLAVVVLSDEFVSVARRGYVNTADAHYHQMLRIVSPYLDAREQAEVESDFAQISSREDYVKVLARLESQCKAHGRTIPKFDPW